MKRITLLTLSSILCLALDAAAQTPSPTPIRCTVQRRQLNIATIRYNIASRTHINYSTRVEQLQDRLSRTQEQCELRYNLLDEREDMVNHQMEAEGLRCLLGIGIPGSCRYVTTVGPNLRIRIDGERATSVRLCNVRYTSINNQIARFVNLRDAAAVTLATRTQERDAAEAALQQCIAAGGI